MKTLYTLLILTGILFLGRCQNSSNSESIDAHDTIKHNTIPSEKIVDRIKAIEKCASCHQEEYKNWLIGPHANAYKSLMDHVKHIDTSANFSDAYKKTTSSQLSTACISCHTGQNLYETVFLGLDTKTDESHFSAKFYPNINKIAPSIRQGKFSSFDTGVDCLTCHKSGNKVVTNGAFKNSGNTTNKNSCDLIASTFFSTNDNCGTCHTHETESMKTFVSEGHLNSEVACNSCHMEYNKQGKPTHYYFWRKDAPEKLRPEKLNMFADIRTEIKLIDGTPTLAFHWGNTYIPHRISACGETVVTIEIRARNGKLLLELDELVNQKGYMMDCVKEAKLFEEGEMGTSLNINDEAIEKEIPLQAELKNLNGGKIIIRGMSKPQFWSDKKELKEVYRKVISIKL